MLARGLISGHRQGRRGQQEHERSPTGNRRLPYQPDRLLDWRRYDVGGRPACKTIYDLMGACHCHPHQRFFRCRPDMWCQNK